MMALAEKELSSAKEINIRRVSEATDGSEFDHGQLSIIKEEKNNNKKRKKTIKKTNKEESAKHKYTQSCTSLPYLSQKSCGPTLSLVSKRREERYKKVL